MIQMMRVTLFLLSFQATITEFGDDGHLDGIIDDLRGRRDAEHRDVSGGHRVVLYRDDGDASDDGVGDRAIGHFRRLCRYRKRQRHHQERLRAERATSAGPDQQLLGEHLGDPTAETQEEPEPHRGYPEVSSLRERYSMIARDQAAPKTIAVNPIRCVKRCRTLQLH